MDIVLCTKPYAYGRAIVGVGIALQVSILEGSSTCTFTIYTTRPFLNWSSRSFQAGHELLSVAWFRSGEIVNSACRVWISICMSEYNNERKCRYDLPGRQ